MKQKLPKIILAWTFLVTVLRALRLPNDFSEAHWLLDYRFGFQKRGLIGSICNGVSELFNTTMSSNAIIILSAIVFLAFLVALLLILTRRGSNYLMAIVFATSPFFVMSGHLFGYFDALLYLLALASISLILSNRVLFGTVVSVLAILIHEAYLLIGMPMVLLAIFVSKPFKLKSLVLQIIPFSLFGFLGLFQSFVINKVALREQLTAFLGSYDFISSRSAEVAIWQTTSFVEYFDAHGRYFFEYLFKYEIAIPVGLFLLVLFVYLKSAFRIKFFSKLWFMVIFSICSPLLMHLVARDSARISTYTIAGGLLVWSILSKTREQYDVSGRLKVSLVFVLLMNLFIHIPLMDGEVERFSNLQLVLLYLPILFYIPIMNTTKKTYPSVKEMSDDQRIGIVSDIFASVPDKYDFLNRFLSLRQDVSWRKRTVKAMNFFETNKFLDVATGTGDLALDCAKAYPGVSVVGVDFVQEMIDAGQPKVVADKLSDRVELKWGDGTDLQFDDESFDVSAIAFGIRNIPDKVKALNEMRRVIAVGGQVMVLELTTPEPGFWRSVYSFYLNGVLPKLAKLFTKNPAAYLYLADSIMNFPTRREFVKLMESVGLKECKAVPLTLGVCTLYIGKK